MTCIVGIADGKNVWMGGDSMSANSWTKGDLLSPKVFIKKTAPKHDEPEQIIFGGCGYLRLLQLLEYALVVPDIHLKQDVMEWLTVDFADAIRQLFKNKGFAVNTNGSEGFGSSEFLIGIRGNIYNINSNYQTVAYLNNEASIGSGYIAAMGSLHATRTLKGQTATRRITMALQAASDIDCYVGGKLTILEI